MSRLMLIGVFCLGLSIFLYPHLAQYHTKRAQFNEVIQIKDELKKIPKAEVLETKTGVEACNEAIFKNERGLSDPFTLGFDRKLFEECRDAPGLGEKVGALEIPKLDLHLPMFIGTSETELRVGVGQVDGSSLPYGGASTHTVLAGHRGMWSKSMFRDIDELDLGDVFYLHTLAGQLAYRVYDVQVIRPFETDSLLVVEGEDLASLMTCHPYGFNTHRLIIYGERIKEDQAP